MINAHRVDRTRIEQAMAHPGAEHLRPIFAAVRDLGVGLLLVRQVKPPEMPPVFELLTDRPSIVLIGDDLHEAFGPAGFHDASLQALVRSARAATIISSGTVTPAYSAMALAPLLTGGNAIVVETQLPQEHAWVEKLNEINPALPVLISTVEGGRA
ncbi:MAG: hypothetical protein ACRC67_07215 [Inquilinus sp.]|uniref:hypothetical protein n=1 Tax=Inquilinus sp. TaxID=1932117 RepID=UPI003F322D02